MSEVKLPKQWKRWIRKAGLKSSYSSDLSRRYGDHYFEGYGRRWRLDCRGFFDMSEKEKTFDRWANSLEKSVPMDAKTESEFMDIMKRLLPKSERWKLTQRRGYAVEHLVTNKLGAHTIHITASQGFLSDASPQ